MTCVCTRQRGSAQALWWEPYDAPGAMMARERAATALFVPAQFFPVVSRGLCIAETLTLSVHCRNAYFVSSVSAMYNAGTVMLTK